MFRCAENREKGNLPDTVIKCCPPLGDSCAWTTATCAVTCWPFWFCVPFGEAMGSATATVICELSLESDDSIGTTSMTPTPPPPAACKIIFFYNETKSFSDYNVKIKFYGNLLIWTQFGLKIA